MATERRVERMQKEILRELSRILREDLRDPRLGMLSLTRVKLSPDLKVAQVFVSALGGQPEWRLSASAIRHARGFIHQALGRHLSTRYIPELHFAYDPSIEKSVRIHKLIDDAAKQRSGRAAAAPAEPGEPGGGADVETTDPGDQ
jgi:ribosome-binding factor A